VKPVLAVLERPARSSEIGALLLKLADDRLRLTRAAAGALSDNREASKVKHSTKNVLEQRVFGIGYSYEDANGVARLHDDSMHKLVLGRSPGAGSELMPGPSISRLENAFDKKQVIETENALSSTVLDRHERRLRRTVRRIVIDTPG